jgi:hypothetical protein
MQRRTSSFAGLTVKLICRSGEGLFDLDARRDLELWIFQGGHRANIEGKGKQVRAKARGRGRDAQY